MGIVINKFLFGIISFGIGFGVVIIIVVIGMVFGFGVKIIVFFFFGGWLNYVIIFVY